MSRSDPPRIAILGAGPVGLEAALYAAALKLPFTIYERGRIGEHLQQWGHVRMFTPFGMNTTSLGRARISTEHPKANLPADNACITGREHAKAYLEPLANSPLVHDHIRVAHTVLHISRKGHLKEDNPGDPKRGLQPFRIAVRDASKTERVEEADVVLDCTGTYARPRPFGQGGVPALGERTTAQHVSYQLDDVLGEKKNHYAGKTTLVIGGGYSAATTVVNLAALAEQHPETWVIWLARTTAIAPLKRIPGDPLKERDTIAQRANTLATRSDGNVEFHNQASIETVEGAWDRGFKLTGRLGNQSTTWNAERILANVGYTPDSDLYRELHVEECPVWLGPKSVSAAVDKQFGDSLTSPPLGPAALRTPEPNFFVLGSKSYGRRANFFLKAGFEQVRDVFTVITGKPDLDLYKPAKR